MKINAYLEITMKIDASNRPAAAKVYTDYRTPFLDTIPGALSKDLLVREDDVQVLHGFDNLVVVMKPRDAHTWVPSPTNTTLQSSSFLFFGRFSMMVQRSPISWVGWL